jgi:spermidine synthase
VVLSLVLTGWSAAVLAVCWVSRGDALPGAPSGALVGAVLLGAAWGGARLVGLAAPGGRSPVVLSGTLGLFAGAWALGLPWGLRALGSWWEGAATGLDPAAAALVGLGLVAVALGPPAAALGAVISSAVRVLVEPPGRAVATVAALLGVGASAGALLAHVVMLPGVGVTATERAAGAVGLWLGAVAVWRGARRDGPARVSGPAPLVDAGGAGTAWGAAALVGFAIAVHVLAAGRMFSQVLVGLGAASTLVVGACLAGLTLGCMWGATRAVVTPLRVIGRLLWLVVGASCLGVWLTPAVSELWSGIESGLARVPQAWLGAQFLGFGLCCAVLLPPMALLGASAVGLRGPTRGAAAGGGALGLVTAEVLGGVGVSLEGVVLAGVAGTLAAALVAGRSAWTGAGARAWVAPVAGVAGVLAWALASRGWSEQALRRAAAAGGITSSVQASFVTQDAASAVVVEAPPGGPRRLWIDGVARGVDDAAVGPQVLAAHLALVAHPSEVKRVLLLGPGAGVAAPSVLAHPIEQLDVVEPSAAVAEAVARAIPGVGEALRDLRCRVSSGAPREFLARAATRYDLIISAPARASGPGGARLLTREALRLARARLAPGGRVVLALDVERASTAMAKRAVRTLRDAFPFGTSWGGPEVLVLVSSEAEQALDVEGMRARLQRPAVAADLERLRLREVTTLLARQVHDDEAQRAFAGEGPVNTDEHDLLGAGAALAAFVRSGAEVEDARLDPARQPGLAWARWRREHPTTATEAGDQHAHLALVHPSSDPLVRASAEAWLALAPAAPEAAAAVARAARSQGNAARGVEVAQPLIDAGARDAALVTEWLLAQAVGLRRAAAPWHPVDVGPVVVIGREALAAHPGDEALARALDRLEAAR